MSAPSELSFEEILKFMLANNGKVTNHELVKHFKVFLMNPDMRNEARNTFKKHVNTLAIIKNQNNEKWLILKKKYFPSPIQEVRESYTSISSEPTVSTVPEVKLRSSPPPYRPPPTLPLNQDLNILSSLIQDNNRNLHLTPTSQMTPMSQMTPSVSELTLSASNDSFTQIQSPDCSFPSEDIPPKIHPRRRSSSDKNSLPKSVSRTSLSNQDVFMEEPQLSQSQSESMLLENEQKISVKERKQMFNRMASESDVPKTQKFGLNTSGSVDEEDRVSLKNETDLFDTKQKQWIICAARGEYHALAKMCKENSKLIKTKDPFTTAMHWACKRGDENLVKLLAGTARHVVNERSGYTPLHIAMQFRHENVYRLLIETYDADPNVRDWSGKKPRQYLVHMDMSLSPGSYRKKESFLRIGSLNVRVKKTTEAFSNFLGVGATRASTYMPKRDRETDRRSDDSDILHKSWGSADNIQKDDKLMPPPSSKVKRRSGNARKGLSSHSQSTPSTPDQPRALMKSNEDGDSDSDSAAGFHAAWRHQRSSCS